MYSSKTVYISNASEPCDMFLISDACFTKRYNLRLNKYLHPCKIMGHDYSSAAIISYETCIQLKMCSSWQPIYLSFIKNNHAPSYYKVTYWILLFTAALCKKNECLIYLIVYGCVHRSPGPWGYCKIGRQIRLINQLVVPSRMFGGWRWQPWDKRTSTG